MQKEHIFNTDEPEQRTMKRKRSSHAQIRLKKRQCLEQNSSTVAALDDAVLRAHYPVVQSLRSYFLSIPSAAARRKQKHTYHDRLNVTSDASIKDAQHDLDVLLDSTLVGSFRTSPNIDVSEEADRAQELIVYSQKVVEGTPGLLSCDDPSAQAQVGPKLHISICLVCSTFRALCLYKLEHSLILAGR